MSDALSATVLVIALAVWIGISVLLAMALGRAIRLRERRTPRMRRGKRS